MAPNRNGMLDGSRVERVEFGKGTGDLVMTTADGRIWRSVEPGTAPATGERIAFLTMSNRDESTGP